jgi:Glyoxalase-like domain
MAAATPCLDHIVVDVREEIDSAAQRFAALGFQLTPRGHHTLGSENHLAIFATDYLELLGFAGNARAELEPFPIGLNGLVFKTADAEGTHRHARAAGLRVLPVQSFSRPVTLGDPQGDPHPSLPRMRGRATEGAQTRDARFRTLRLDPKAVPMGRVYFCEHLTPELVWRKEWQAHPNGALAIGRVVVVTPDPARTAALFQTLFGSAAVVAAPEGRVTVAAGTARVELTTPNAVAAEFGTAAAWPEGRREYLATAEFKVQSLAETARRLGPATGVQTDRGRVVVPAAVAFNTTLVFAE